MRMTAIMVVSTAFSVSHEMMLMNKSGYVVGLGPVQLRVTVGFGDFRRFKAMTHRHVAAFRADINDPISSFNHIYVVFNDHQGIALVSKSMQDTE